MGRRLRKSPFAPLGRASVGEDRVEGPLLRGGARAVLSLRDNMSEDQQAPEAFEEIASAKKVPHPR